MPFPPAQDPKHACFPPAYPQSAVETMCGHSTVGLERTFLTRSMMGMLTHPQKNVGMGLDECLLFY